MQYPFISVSEISNEDILNCYCDKITFKGQIDLLKAYKEATKLPSPFIGYRLQISILTISIALLGGSWYGIESKNMRLSDHFVTVNQQIALKMPMYKEYESAISKLRELEIGRAHV